MNLDLGRQLERAMCLRNSCNVSYMTEKWAVDGSLFLRIEQEQRMEREDLKHTTIFSGTKRKNLDLYTFLPTSEVKEKRWKEHILNEWRIILDFLQCPVKNVTCSTT